MMTALKTWCLLPLAVLLLSIAPTLAEVVQSMSQCKGFLLQETPPHIPGVLEDSNIQDQKRYKPICQNTSSSVTLYDTRNKIPVFSAHKYTGAKMGRPDIPWKIESHLEERMSNIWGHFFPSSHVFDETDKIIKQVQTFRGRTWQNMVSCIKCILEKYCINNTNVIESYVVTGALSAKNKKLPNKVNKPSVLWSAFCCYSKDKNKWLASAYWGENSAEKSKSKYLPTKTLKELQDNLQIVVFPKTNCPQNETVAEFYPEIKKTCQCPPQASY